MRVPADAIIADEKLTHYLLVQRPFDDKSGFLAKAGFSLYNWSLLRDAIRTLAAAVDAVKDVENEYGEFYLVRGRLTGPGATVNVKLVWIQRRLDARFVFVTLAPLKE